MTPGAPYAGCTDAELLLRHAEGDAEAFGEVVRRHRDRLWAVALRTSGNPEDAADALQDALISAFRSGAGGHGGTAAYRGEAAVTSWLHRIVVNACLDRLRRARARPAVALPEEEPAAAQDSFANSDIAMTVQAALATLPVEQRAALVLVDLQGWSVDEAAHILQVAPGTVKSRCSRGRARLLPLLGELQDPNDPAEVAIDPSRRSRNRPEPLDVPPASASEGPASS